MNIALCVMKIIPTADPDPVRGNFLVAADGDSQSIVKWEVKDTLGNPVQEPTITELEAVWLSALTEQKIKEFKVRATEELAKTDYKVLRHRDQVSASVTTSLTDAEYIQLCKDRQAIRDKSNSLETQVKVETTEAKILAVVW